MSTLILINCFVQILPSTLTTHSWTHLHDSPTLSNRAQLEKVNRIHVAEGQGTGQRGYNVIWLRAYRDLGEGKNSAYTTGMERRAIIFISDLSFQQLLCVYQDKHLSSFNSYRISVYIVQHQDHQTMKRTAQPLQYHVLYSVKILMFHKYYC